MSRIETRPFKIVQNSDWIIKGIKSNLAPGLTSILGGITHFQFPVLIEKIAWMFTDPSLMWIQNTSSGMFMKIGNQTYPNDLSAQPIDIPNYSYLPQNGNPAIPYHIKCIVDANEAFELIFNNGNEATYEILYFLQGRKVTWDNLPGIKGVDETEDPEHENKGFWMPGKRI